MAIIGAAEHQDPGPDMVAAAMPVTFAGTVGLFMPATGPRSRTAVLFLSPWGFEEMCTRKFWRILAEDLANAGIASLRFDYTGTGDALDIVESSDGLKSWEDTSLAAAEMLKSLSGCDRLVLISQGLGSSVAHRIAGQLPDVDGIAFLAPTISGRAYLRELTVWSKMIDEGMGLTETQRPTEGVTIASLRLPDDIAAAVKKLNLMTLADVGTAECLVLTRPGRPGDVDFASHLQSLGTRVEQAAYVGYDELISNPTIATMPLEAGKKILDWVETIAVRSPPAMRKILRTPRAEPLVADGFRETPLRFGAGGRLFGVLCEPTGAIKGATVLLLTTAYDRHAGWGRMSVIMARSLARDGIPSLRFDTANVADSPPLSGAPEQVLYSDDQRRDVGEAIDLLESKRLLPTLLVGRCSGGYLAFQAALRDDRCNGLITVNPYAFFWDETQSVDEALRFVPRSLETYGQKFLQLETLKRLYDGQIDAKSAARNILASLARRASRLGRPLLGAFPFFSNEHESVIGGFRALSKRHVDVSLIYSAHDIGLEHFHEHFGDDAAYLKNFPDMRVNIIPDADHNLTPPHARSIYLEEVREMALRLARQP